MRKKARLIYNPVAGRELLKDNLANLLDIYENAGFETSAFRTTSEPISAQKEAKRAAEEGFDLIIAAGGDGTVNEVVAGISPLPQRPIVAVVPGGTSNDYAHALGISRTNILEAARCIYKKQTIPMDIGYAKSPEGRRTFVNIAAMGTLTELSYRVSSELKTIFGYLAYFAKGAELLPQARNSDLVRITYDDGVYQGDASLIFVTLTETFGGLNYVAPDSIPGDGNFTLIVVKTNNVARIANLFFKILSNGQHVGEKDIIYTKASHIKVESLDEEPIKVNLDGELGGVTPVEFINLQQHIEFVADVDNMANQLEKVNENSNHLEDFKKEFFNQIEDYDKEKGD